MIVDFHSHTTASDGSVEPAGVLKMMRDRAVEICSITDHDSLHAYDGLNGAAEGLTLVPGIEINTTYKGNEVHVLGYGLPLDDSPVRRLIDRNRNSRRDRAAQMIAQLRGAGYDITLDQVRAEATEDDPALGRPHVARALVKAGLIRDVDACFRTVLGRGGVGYVPQTYTTPQEAVDVIAQSGGVPVLAHPGRLKDQSIVDELAEYGVVGLEVFYPTHSSTQVAYYREVAERYGLVMTAGADFHDIRWHPAGVGMDVDRDDIEDFLDLII